MSDVFSTADLSPKYVKNSFKKSNKLKNTDEIKVISISVNS